MRPRFFSLLLLVLGLIGSTSNASAGAVGEEPDAGWLRESPTRTRLSLNGEWEWSREGEEVWQPIQIPAAFDYIGEATYRKRFEVDSTLAGRTFLLISWGINYRVVVTVNGRFVGSHAGYYAGLQIEIPAGLLHVGSGNEIVLAVSNRLDPRHTLPLKHQPRGPRNYGGILREIFLFAVPANRVQSARTRVALSADFSKCRLTVHANIKRPERSPEEVRCAAELWDPGEGRPVARSAQNLLDFRDRVSADATLDMDVANPHLWDFGDPFLYELRLTVWTGDSVSDEYRQSIGLRQVEMTQAGIRLNGRVVATNGVDWVEGYGESGSPVGSPRQMAGVIGRVKELGARFVRVVAHPPHPYFLDLADSAGILVFLDDPVRGVPRGLLTQPAFGDLAERALATLIETYGNHPSVAAWGLGYGLNAGLREDVDANRMDPPTAFLLRLRDTAQRLDDRPVYYVSRSVAEARRRLPVDLVIIDLLERSSVDIFEEFSSANHHAPLQPVIARIGFSLEPHRDGGPGVVDPEIRIEERQAHRLQMAMARLRETANPAGILIAYLTDWNTPTTPLNVSWDGHPLLYPAGLLDNHGEKRVSYSLVKADFTGDTLPHITQINYPAWRPVLVPLFGLLLILCFLFFLNRDRRLRGHLRRVFVHPHGVYQELRDMRKIPPFLTTLLAIVELGAVAALITSLLLPLRSSPVFDEVVDLFLSSPWLKLQLKWLMWHPVFLLITTCAFLTVVVAANTILLWFLGLLFGRPLPFGQLFTLAIWSGASFLWTLVLVPIYYRLVESPQWRGVAIMLFVAFFAWFIARLFRAMRAIYFLSFVRTGLLVGAVTVIFIFAFAFYYDKTQALFAYIPYYWTLFHNI